MLGRLHEKENKKVKEIALEMLECNIEIVDIMEVTGLTEEEILHLQNVE